MKRPAKDGMLLGLFLPWHSCPRAVATDVWAVLNSWIRHMLLESPSSQSPSILNNAVPA